jgi:5-methylcytosine-specific restriction enzyme A
MPARPITIGQSRRPRRTPAIEPQRGTTAERGYDADWKRLRARFLTSNPLCQCTDCMRLGRRWLANVVNHIQDIRDRPDLRLDWDNLQAMSKRCHDRHTKLKQLAIMRSRR